MERSILSWKEPFEVGKLEMKLERMALVGRTKMKLETTALVGKKKSDVGNNCKVKLETLLL